MPEWIMLRPYQRCCHQFRKQQEYGSPLETHDHRSDHYRRRSIWICVPSVHRQQGNAIVKKTLFPRQLRLVEENKKYAMIAAVSKEVIDEPSWWLCFRILILVSAYRIMYYVFNGTFSDDELSSARFTTSTRARLVDITTTRKEKVSRWLC